MSQSTLSEDEISALESVAKHGKTNLAKYSWEILEEEPNYEAPFEKSDCYFAKHGVIDSVSDLDLNDKAPNSTNCQESDADDSSPMSQQESLYHPADWEGDYVYIIEANPGVVKIGISGQVQKRIQTLNRASPQELQLKAAIGVTKPATVESWLHAELNDYNTKGEWFNIGADKVDDLVKKVKSLSSISDF